MEQDIHLQGVPFQIRVAAADALLRQIGQTQIGGAVGDPSAHIQTQALLKGQISLQLKLVKAAAQRDGETGGKHAGQQKLDGGDALSCPLAQAEQLFVLDIDLPCQSQELFAQRGGGYAAGSALENGVAQLILHILYHSAQGGLPDMERTGCRRDGVQPVYLQQVAEIFQFHPFFLRGP